MASSPQPKESPILFNAPMVRAILEGRKTVTRRAVRAGFNPDDLEGTLNRSECRKLHRELPQYFGAAYFCPYGQPGDRLWVRESWWQAGDWQATYPEDDTGAWFGSRRVVYSSDGTPPNEPNTSYPSGLRNGAYSAAAPNKIWRHRPSIHMPRWACRILLEITGVRVERLQDISEDQALAEGIIPHVRGGWHWHPHDPSNVDDWHQFGFKSAAYAFQDLWIGTGGNWEANPWVWVVEFKRVTQ